MWGWRIFLAINYAKVIGVVSALLGLSVLAFPIPDNYKVYILGAETMLNGFLQLWYGTLPPVLNPPSPPTTTSKVQMFRWKVKLFFVR